jgi:hypothetical protein
MWIVHRYSKLLFDSGPKTVKLLLEKGAQAEVICGDCTPLKATRLRGYIETTKLHIDHKADIDYRYNLGQSRVNIALSMNRNKVFELLKGKGCVRTPQQDRMSEPLQHQKEHFPRDSTETHVL